MEIKDLLGNLFKDGMTDEEIVKAIQGLEAPKPKEINDDEVKHLKSLISKANSEASKYKKQLQEKMTDEEKLKAEHDAEFEKIQSELNELKIEKRVSEQKAELVGLGYDSENADTVAKAMVSGDLKAVIEGQKNFLESYKKKVLADELKDTPRPKTKNDDKHASNKKFSEMSYIELRELHQSNPDEYERLKNEGK